MAWWRDVMHIVCGPGERPGHQRVRVPHVAGSELVPPPGQRRDLRQHVQHRRDLGCVVTDPVRRADCFGQVGDTSAGPAPDLVSKRSGPPEPSGANRPFAHDAAVRCRDIPHRTHLDRVRRPVKTDLHGRVIQVVRSPMPTGGDQTLVDATVPPDAVPAGAERQPVEVDPGLEHERSPARCHVAVHPMLVAVTAWAMFAQTASSIRRVECLCSLSILVPRLSVRTVALATCGSVAGRRSA